MKSHNQYYTSEEIASKISEYLTSVSAKPVKCVELCAGVGGLISPLVRHWPELKIVTCDIDEANRDYLTNKFPFGKHCLVDVTNRAFEDHAHEIGHKKFDLAVCNPPFSWIENDDYIQEVLYGLFGNLYSSYKRVRQEVVFIAQNYKFLKDEGFLCLIIPELLVSGQSNEKFRTALTKSFSLQCLMEVGGKSFKGTDAATFILILRKASATSSTYEYVEQGGIKKLCFEKDFIAGRLHRNASSHLNLNVEIFRGKTSGKATKAQSLPYFHTDCFKECTDGFVFSSTLSSLGTIDVIYNQRSSVAIPGDILIARVGSRVVGKTVLVRSGRYLVSDCIYVVRYQDASMSNEIFENYRSELESSLSAIARGTCAKYITLGDIASVLESFEASIVSLGRSVKLKMN